MRGKTIRTPKNTGKKMKKGDRTAGTNAGGGYHCKPVRGKDVT